jgi:hypothetical protein
MLWRTVHLDEGCEIADPARTNLVASSPTATQGAMVLPLVTMGNTDASATRSPSRPWTRRRPSTTEVAASLPLRAVPHWCQKVPSPRRRYVSSAGRDKFA